MKAGVKKTNGSKTVLKPEFQLIFKELKLPKSIVRELAALDIKEIIIKTSEQFTLAIIVTAKGICRIIRWVFARINPISQQRREFFGFRLSDECSKLFRAPLQLIVLKLS
jgi:hypothetical protein